MSNINSGQFFNNYSNTFNRFAANGVQNTEVSGTAVQSEQQTIAEMKTLFPAATEQLAQTAAELASLNQQQTVDMLKYLLNLPKNLEMLISQLTVSSSAANRQNLLFLLSSNLDLSLLSSLLQNGSKEALANLYQMAAQYNTLGMSLKDEQLSALSKLISFISASSSSDVQSLRTMMLMYLPWLPLTEPDTFKLEISNKGQNGGSDGEDSVTALISTENYGNLQADIIKTEKDGVKIDITSSETFPQNELENAMQEESKKYGININIDFQVKPVFNKDKKEQTKTRVYMNTSPGVNPFLLLISSSLIKNVHLMDEKANLREQRKEKL